MAVVNGSATNRVQTKICILALHRWINRTFRDRVIKGLAKAAPAPKAGMWETESSESLRLMVIWGSHVKHVVVRWTRRVLHRLKDLHRKRVRGKKGFACRIYCIVPPTAGCRVHRCFVHRPDMRDLWLRRVHSNKVHRDQPSVYSNPNHKRWEQVPE